MSVEPVKGWKTERRFGLKEWRCACCEGKRKYKLRDMATAGLKETLLEKAVAEHDELVGDTYPFVCDRPALGVVLISLFIQTKEEK